MRDLPRLFSSAERDGSAREEDGMMGEAIFLAFEDPVHQGGWNLVIASYASLQNLLLRVLSLAG